MKAGKEGPMKKNFGSALLKKENKAKVDMNDPKQKANYEKYKDNPEYRKALDKKAGGKFSYDEKANTGTVRKNI